MKKILVLFLLSITTASVPLSLKAEEVELDPEGKIVLFSDSLIAFVDGSTYLLNSDGYEEPFLITLASPIAKNFTNTNVYQLEDGSSVHINGTTVT
ncbi:MAG: hypothetical protein WCR80_06055, partial [Bacilli bacterium]